MDGRKADAVLFPIGMFATMGGAVARQYGIRGAFQGVLGDPRLQTSTQPGLGMCLVTRATGLFDRALHFMGGHPLGGQERHQWFVIARQRDGTWINVRPVGSYGDTRGDVLAGYLIKDPFAGENDVMEQVQRDFDAKVEASRRPELRRAKLDAFLAAGHIDAAEHEEEVRRQGLADVEAPREPSAAGATRPAAGALGIPRPTRPAPPEDADKLAPG